MTLPALRIGALVAAGLLTIATSGPIDYAGDATALDALIVANYAYLAEQPGGVLPETPALAAARAAVRDRPRLLHYAESRMASLADFHANVGTSFKDSWALVPSYADLHLAREVGGFVVDAVRADTPAARAGIGVGTRIVAVGGVPVATAIQAFWTPSGLAVTPVRADYAAQVIAAGRRDRPRVLTIGEPGGGTRTLTLATLYASQPPSAAPLSIDHRGATTVIRFANSLGDRATIAAFDAAMAVLPRNVPVTLDLTDTPSGGNTVVARAVMGWFVDRPRAYQIHRAVAEERETGIAHQWIEQVSPRAGRYHARLPDIRVGRWTGSMGEGIAVGFAALGARVHGTAMAGLRGAISDFTLPASAIRVSFPTEQLFTIGGTPREAFVPMPTGR